MIILLNGPLGIGKTTLAEVLSECIDGCVMLDGDHLVAANPPHSDGYVHLHSTLALLVAHHRSFGYRHFVIDHFWGSRDALDDLGSRLRASDPDAEIRCFRLTLEREENLRRIERRAGVRAIDERAFELRTVEQERRVLDAATASELGEPLDVVDPPDVIAKRLLERIGL